jgi:hypothetical protein
MNAEELAEFAKVQNAARALADHIATGDENKLPAVRELDFAKAYSIIYNIAMRPLPVHGASQANLYGTGEELYLRFQQLLTELVKRHPISPHQSTEGVFRAVVAKWNQFLLLEKWMLKAFQYISRFYVPHLTKPPLSFLSLVIFNQEVFKKHERVINSVLLSDIQRMRAGENVDRERMKDAVRLLLKMGFGDRMSPEFVRELLAATAQHYRDESRRCVASHGPVEYTRRVHSWLLAEQQLASWVLPDTSVQQFVGEVEREAVAQHLPFILDAPEGGFVSLLRANRVADLRFLLSIMMRPQANGVPHMARLLKKECLADGERIVAKYSNDKQFVDADARGFVSDFVELHERYAELIQSCLNHPSFVLASREAFETTINAGVVVGPPFDPSNDRANVVTSSQLIAQYTDQILRGGPQFHMSDTELDALLNKIVSLFTRIHDKDGFFDALRETLSRRLLSAHAAPSADDRERMLISKFRAKCGASATNRLEGMLHDVDGSRALAERFAVSNERRLALAALAREDSAASSNGTALPAGAAAARASGSSASDRDRESSSTPTGSAMMMLPSAMADPSVGSGGDERGGGGGAATSSSPSSPFAAPAAASAAPQHDVDFSPLLLTEAFWPTMAAETLLVPAPVAKLSDAFSRFYCAGRHHRQVKWVFQFGTAVLKCNVNPTYPCELLINLYQAAVIYAFNDRDELRVGDLAAITGLSVEDVSRHVHSFATSRVGLLEIVAPAAAAGTPTAAGAAPMRIPLDTNQVVRIDASFAPSQRKLRVPALVVRTPAPGSAAAMAAAAAALSAAAAATSSSMTLVATSSMGGMGAPSLSAVSGAGAAAAGGDQRTEAQRVPMVEATVMKVMKSRQRVEHAALVAAVMDHLVQRFRPEPRFVKQCIESLLHRDFISRDAADANVYVFQTT